MITGDSIDRAVEALSPSVPADQLPALIHSLATVKQRTAETAEARPGALRATKPRHVDLGRVASQA